MPSELLCVHGGAVSAAPLSLSLLRPAAPAAPTATGRGRLSLRPRGGLGAPMHRGPFPLRVCGAARESSTKHKAKDLGMRHRRQGFARRALMVGALPFVVAALHTGSSRHGEDSITIHGQEEPTMRRLIQYLQEVTDVPADAERQRLHDVMLRVDRRKFVPPDVADKWALADTPIPIGHEQTISAPHMHEMCLYELKDKLMPGASVLDVGSGSGYLTACMGLLVAGEGGHVLGIEKVTDLAVQSVDNIQAACPELIRDRTVTIAAGDVLSADLSFAAPFDAIHVGAASRVVHQRLLDMLKPDGVMILPVGLSDQFSSQVLTRVVKDASGSVDSTPLRNVRFVPLTEPDRR